MEEVGEHADATLLDLRRLGILGVVDEVAVQVLLDDRLRLGLHVGSDEGREVSHRISIEAQLLRQEVHRVLGRHSPLGQMIVGRWFQAKAVSVGALQHFQSFALEI